MSLSGLAEIAEEIKSPQDTILVLQTLLQYKPRALVARRLLRTIEVDQWEERKEKKFNPFNKIRTEAISLKIIPVLSQAEKAKQENRPEEVLEFIEKVLETNPCHERANLLLADAAHLMSEPDIAAFAYEMICYEQPDNLHYLHLLAEAYVKAADYVSATETYRRILDSAPDDRDAIQGLKALSGAMVAPSAADGYSFASKPAVSAENVEAQPDASVAVDPVVVEEHLRQLDERIQFLQPSGSSTAPELEEWEQLQHERRYYALQLAYHQATAYPDDHTLALTLARAYVDNHMFAEAMQIYESLMSDSELRVECYRGMSIALVRQGAHEQMLEMGSMEGGASTHPALSAYMGSAKPSEG